MHNLRNTATKLAIGATIVSLTVIFNVIRTDVGPIPSKASTMDGSTFSDTATTRVMAMARPGFAPS
jgi:hypothetical protein